MVELLSLIYALVAVILLIENFIKRTLHTRQMVGVLEEKNYLTTQNYKMLLQSNAKTKAVRHEMRHHMNALYAFINNNDAKRASEYIASVEKELEKISDSVYCNNILINAIAGKYINQAKENNIDVDYQLLVPETIGIADELCVLITNMLENAVEACERIKGEQRGYIKIMMKIEGQYLFIGCKNSTSAVVSTDNSGEFKTEKSDKSMHGCGIVAFFTNRYCFTSR